MDHVFRCRRNTNECTRTCIDKCVAREYKPKHWNNAIYTTLQPYCNCNGLNSTCAYINLSGFAFHVGYHFRSVFLLFKCNSIKYLLNVMMCFEYYEENVKLKMNQKTNKQIRDEDIFEVLSAPKLCHKRAESSCQNSSPTNLKAES